jgi:hypothetical protein
MSSIYENIIASFIWLLIITFVPFLFSKIRKRIKIRKRKQFNKYIGMNRDRKILFVLGASDHQSNSDKKYKVINVFEHKLLFDFHKELFEIYGDKLNIEMLFEPESFKEYSETNFILIGGPGTNILVDNLVRTEKILFHINNDYKNDRSLNDWNNIKYNVKKCEETIIDYGIIARIPNPYSSNNSIIVLYGIESFGTYGAILGVKNIDSILTEKYSRSKYWRKIKKAKFFQLLFEITVQNNIPPKSIKILDGIFYNGKHQYHTSPMEIYKGRANHT